MATIYEHRIAEPVVKDRRLAFADFAEAECPQSEPSLASAALDAEQRMRFDLMVGACDA